MQQSTRKPGLVHALICFGVIFLSISLGVLVFNVNMHSLLLISLVWACSNAAFLRHDFASIRKAMGTGLQKAHSAIYIFLLIGVLIAALIESGTIAATVYYALGLVVPALFLPGALLLCSIMSITTGTSWGTVGTVGVIIIAIAGVIGMPLAIVAGVVVSGATFGDKMSPISDTTNLAAACAGTELYSHIKSMLYTTVPSFILCLVAFTFIGFQFAPSSLPAADIAAFRTALDGEFEINVFILMPLLVLVALSMLRVAAEPAMIGSVLTCVVIAVLVQDRSVVDVLGSLQAGFHIDSGNAQVDILLNRGGIESMMSTLSLALIALALGGVLTEFGFLDSLLSGLMSKVRSVTGLVATTIGSCFVGNLTMGEVYLSIILGCQLFRGRFKAAGLKMRMLSRCSEEGATVTAALIPWTTTGAFFAAALGVQVTDYAPYALLNIINPLMSIFLTYIGFGVLTSNLGDSTAKPAVEAV